MNLKRKLKCLFGKHEWKGISISENVHNQYSAKRIEFYLKDRAFPPLHKIALGNFNKECIHCGKKSFDLDKIVKNALKECDKRYE